MKTCTLALAILAALAAPLAAAQSQSVAPVPQDTSAEAAAAEPTPVAQDTATEATPADADAVVDPAAVAEEAPAPDPFMLFHLGGFADVTFVKTQGAGKPLGLFTLAPIFHLQFGERVFFEAELELEGDDRGESNAAVEYADINFLINDYAALVVGRFLTPLGNFAQNVHPSWINKLASTPVGFGHGGAATGVDFGVQVRGGKAFTSGQQLNYAVYMGNGAQLELEDGDSLDLGKEGQTRDPDGKRVSGGRVGWLPFPALEVGVSMARGNVKLDAAPVSDLPEPARDYRVDGFDATWRPTQALDLRAEWIRQKIGEAPGSLVPDAALWRAWFVQGAYRFGADKWEAVARYGDSLTPHGESTLKQTAFGINYLGINDAVIKLTWELNDAADEDANADRLLLQFAYAL